MLSSRVMQIAEARMSKELRRFQATSAAGDYYTVVEHGQVASHKPLSGSGTEIIGPLAYVLDDGREVSATSDPDEFIIVATEERIRRPK